mgnify:CR=1 FL=1
MNSRDNHIQNRRRYRRYPISASASLKINDGKDSPALEILAANISRSGLGAYSYVPIPDNISVSIEMSFAGIKGIEKASLEGKIMHSSRLGSLYYIGIDFSEELNPDSQPLLYSHFWKIIETDK